MIIEKMTMRDKNISKISISSRKLDKIKVFKILELLDIDNMIMYIDDEYNDDFFKVLKRLGVDYLENFDTTFNGVFLRLDKEKYLKLFEYTKEQDILISNYIVKDNWRFYINVFTNEIFSGILSQDTDCILEIDDYEGIINVRFWKDKFNRKDLVNSLKEILR